MVTPLLTTSPTRRDAVAVAGTTTTADTPKAGKPTVGSPSSSTGVVTGKLNITDPQKLALTYTVSSDATGGSVAITSTGSFTYTPSTAARNAAGTTTKKTTDTFTVTATNTLGNSVDETVTVTVSPILDKPVAGTPMTNALDAATGAVTGTLGITDPQNLTLTYSSTKPAKGTVTVATDGTFTYTPTVAARKAAGATLKTVTDTFTVTAKNGVSSVTEKVTVTVDPIADIPVAGTPTVGKAGSSGVITGKLAITDPAKLKLTYTTADAPSGGTLKVSSTGSYTYTPTLAARIASANSDTPITDTFTVTATNTVGKTTSQTVTVTVAPLVDTPKAGTPSIGKPDVTTGIVTGTAKFTDPAKLPLTYSVSSDPANGTVTVSSTGAFTYTPSTAARELAGATTKKTTDAFTITATNAVSSTSRVITVTVSPIPDKPTAGIATFGNPNTTTGAVTGNLNATDPQDLALTYTTTTKPAKGSVTVSSTTGSFTYTPTAAALKAAKSSTTPVTDTFTVTIKNTVGNSTTEKVTVTVGTSTTQAPVAGTPLVGTANAGTGVVVGALNFTDPTGSTLTYTVSTKPTQGSVTVTTTGQFTYVPTTSALSQATGSSTDTFTVTAVNSTGRAAAETVTVPIGANSNAGTASVYNPIGVTGSPGVMVAAPSGNNVYVLSSQGSGSSASYTLSTIDTRPTSSTFGTVVSTLDLSSLGSVTGLTINASGTQIYAVGTVSASVLSLTSKLAIISTATNTITKTVSLGSSFIGAPVIAGNNVYVVGETLGFLNLSIASTVVKVFNTTTNTLTSTITIPTPSGNNASGVTGFVISPDGGTLYVGTAATSTSTYKLSETMSVISTATNAITNTFAIAGGVSGGVAALPQGFVTDGGHIYAVGNNASGSPVVTVFNTDGSVANTIALPTGVTPVGLALSPDTGTLYVASSGNLNSKVLVIDTATNTITKTIIDRTIAIDGAGTSETATSLAVGADGTLYLANSGSITGNSTDITFGNVTAINTAWTTVVAGNGGRFDVPIADANVIGTPNATTGVITGTAKFIDPASQKLTYTVTANPGKGTAIVDSAGNFTYTPAVGATGGSTDTFTITATNAAGNTATATITVTVTAPAVVST